MSWGKAHIRGSIGGGPQPGVVRRRASAGPSQGAGIGAGDNVDYNTDSWGLELTLARVFSLRRGHYTDRVGQIDGETTAGTIAEPRQPHHECAAAFRHPSGEQPGGHAARLDDEAPTHQ